MGMTVFFGVWAALLYMTYRLRHIRDELGEYLAMAKALRVSLGSLGCTVIVEILQIDGLAQGRAVMTGSVLMCIASFFFLQNYDALRAVLTGQDKAVSAGVQRGLERTQTDLALEELEGCDAGYDATSAVNSPTSMRSRVNKGRHQTLFSKAVMAK